MEDLRKNSNKGITIIALAITIIIMLILAAVTVGLLRGDGGIISKAQDAKGQTEVGSLKEKVELSKAEAENKHRNATIDDVIDELIEKNVITNRNQVNKRNGKIKTDSGIVLEGMLDDYIEILPGAPDENGIFTANSTVDGGPASADNPTVPAGFKPIPTETSTWTGEWKAKPTEEDLKNGLVIQDADGNEFVWIPINSDLTVLGTEKVMAKESTAKGFAGTDDNGRINYEGVFYDFIETTSTEMSPSLSGQGTEWYREPDTTGYDTNEEYLTMMKEKLSEEADRYKDYDTFRKTLQEDYNEMIDSVKTYGGFYVGRYEMAIKEGKATSKIGPVAHSGDWSTAVQWWGLYSFGKKYTNTKNSVRSSMIWGSQYDAMLNYALTGNDKDKVTAKGIGHYGESAVETGTTLNDKILNIFDLGGNHGDWTLEVIERYLRTYRGGYYNGDVGSPSSRNRGFPDATTDWYCTRLTLYIKENPE